MQLLLYLIKCFTAKAEEPRDPERTYKKLEKLFLNKFSFRKSGAQSDCRGFWKDVKDKPAIQFRQLYDNKVRDLTSKAHNTFLEKFLTGTGPTKQKALEPVTEPTASIDITESSSVGVPGPSTASPPAEVKSEVLL